MSEIDKPLHKPHVVVKVQGGLGNQLFCYAVARALALRQKRKCYLDAFSGYVNDQFDRSFKLKNLKVSPDVEILQQAVLDPAKLDKRLHKFLPLKYRSYIKEKYVNKRQFAGCSFSKDALYLDGYWQSEAYFRDIRQVLLGELQYDGRLSETDQRVLKKIKASNSVMVHIRRVAYGQVLSEDYYKAAVRLITEKVENPVFFIFGDDLEWIKAAAVFENTAHVYVAHNDQYHELHDFELMKACRHAIIANSSFSWWGAWLIDNPKKTVVSPDHSGFALEMPDDWVKVKVRY